MAKGKRGKRDVIIHTPSLTSVASPISGLLAPVTYVQTIAEGNFEEIFQSDRRVYHPEGEARPAASRSGKRHTLRALYNAPLQAIGFKSPRSVMVCVRRQTRKEVLHALNLTKKGSRGGKRRNYYSNVRCK